MTTKPGKTALGTLFANTRADRKTKLNMAVKESSDVVRKWFTDHKWRFDERKLDSGEIVFKTSVAADSNLYKGYDISIICREGDVQSLFYPPVKATPRHYPLVTEYLMRVNYRFRCGKWTLDYEDGEVRFEVIKDGKMVEMEPEDSMDDLLGFAEYVCDGFSEGVAQVITGAKTPVQAYEEADARDEMPDPDPDDIPDEDDEYDCAPDETVVDGVTESGVVLPNAEQLAKKAEKEREKKGSKNMPVNALPKGYSLEGLNVEGKVPLAEIVAAIKKFREQKCDDVDAPRLNILLSGAPGSGKTAFARYIANEVGVKLVTVKASDILSRYVGETERRIEKVFAEAKKQGSILFLDEVDSVLINRRFAERSFEITQTNQLLQCMESFEGVIIAATNLVENLDEAVMRRFTYKLKLSYLTDAGKVLFFKRYFGTPLTDEQRKRLNSLERLTPGDFRTVKEGLYYLSDKQNNDARLDALAVEAAAKGQPRAKIGF